MTLVWYKPSTDNANGNVHAPWNDRTSAAEVVMVGDPKLNSDWAGPVYTNTNELHLKTKTLSSFSQDSVWLQSVNSRGHRHKRILCLSLIFLSKILLPPFCVCLYSADTLTTFCWCAWPAGSGASASGVVSGGVGMVMMAVVIWPLWQFRAMASSTHRFKLQRLHSEIEITCKWMKTIYPQIGLKEKKTIRTIT